MPRNGSGTYSAPAASFPAVSGAVVDSAKYNAVVNDVGTALTGSIAADGQTSITANLPMAAYRHTGVGDATALTQYASANQVADNALTYGGASAAGTDTYAVSLPVSPGVYQAGQRFQFLTDVDNTGAATLNVNALGAKTIALAGGATLLNGQIQASSFVDVMYDGTNFILLNPSYADNLTCININATTFTGALTGNVTGNVTGSAGSCTGNSATATLATNATNAATAVNFSGSLIGDVTGIQGATVVGNDSHDHTLSTITDAGSLASLDEVDGTNFPDLSAGTYIYAQSIAATTGTHTSLTKVKEIYCPTAGTVTVDFDMKATNGGSSVTGRVYLDGVATGTNRTTNSTTYVTYSENISVSAGDLIQIYSSGIGTNYVFISQFKVKAAANAHFAVVLE